MIESSGQQVYKLWWSKFNDRISRWSIGSKVGDDSSVIAYKDSHALHPSEIARQRSLWRVYDIQKRKWVVDQSIHVKCIDVISAFEWEGDCLVLGITNTNLDTKRPYHYMDALDYLKVSGNGLNAKYYSTSTKLTISHNGNEWSIIQDGTTKAFAKTDKVHPNALKTDDGIKWTLDNQQNPKYLSVHCEVPEAAFYYKNLREKYEVCSIDVDADGEQVDIYKDFSNDHFNTVVMREIDEWKFGLTEDMKYFTWNETESGKSHKIPSIGIGTAGMNNDEEVILWAINKYGYELIDSASDHAPWYQNEKIIGRLLSQKRLKRDQFMVTTKLYAKDQGLNGAKYGLDDSLKGLNVDYIDIYLIHHPHCDNKFCDGSWKTSWRIIEDYYFKNKIKYVGVSNFDINQFHELLDWTRIPISVIQNWFDPFQQKDKGLVNECKKLGIVYQAYSTLGTQWKYIGSGYRGNKDPIFTNKNLKEIATRYEGKSVAQIVLRWALQNKIAILPSSTKEARVKENNQLFDFELSDQDLLNIDQIE